MRDMYDPERDVDWSDVDSTDLADVLGDALSDHYGDCGPEELDEALGEILESMSPAESVNFTKALQRIGHSAGQVTADPTFQQIARTGLPLAGGAIGTVLGGPAGTAAGSRLGAAAARALPRTTVETPSQQPAQPVSGVAGGSAAAAQGLVLSQQPDVLRCLLALALGDHGKKAVNGVPVARVMNMLSSVFGRAAADADELMYLDRAESEARYSGGFALGLASVPDRSLYTALLDADNYELAEAMDLP